MDRVDRWLNAQHGRRRLYIGLLIMLPALVNAGLWWSGWGNYDEQRNMPTGRVLLHVAIVVLVGLAVAAAVERLARRKRKARPPAPAANWRWIAGLEATMTGQAIMAYGSTRTLASQHRLLPYAALLLLAGGVLLALHGIYARKLRRQARAAGEGAAS